MSENYYDRIERKGSEILRRLLAKPMPESGDMLGCDGEFDPWDLLPCLYGSYSSAFDKLAIEVLCDIRDGEHRRDDLPAEMFREMLCTAGLCNYGTSPRVCFATNEFSTMLPELISKWRTYAALVWGESVTEMA